MKIKIYKKRKQNAKNMEKRRPIANTNRIANGKIKNKRRPNSENIRRI